MKKLSPLLFILMLLIGCRPQVDEETGTSAPTIAAFGGQPIPVSLSELAANPAVYEGAYIQLTGRYTRLPLLVCESNVRPSPATWGLSSDTLMALAGGFDGQLRPLLTENLTMTVAGRWQHWEGLVGCGDMAQSQDIWYLAVRRVISPNPIAQATLTPGGSLVVADDGAPAGEGTAVSPTDPTESPDGETIFTPTLPPDGPIDPDSTPISTPTSPIRLGEETSTPAGSNFASPTNTPVTGASTPANNLTPTNTPVVGDITPTSTSVSGDATPTPSDTPPPGTTPTTLPTPTLQATPTSVPALDSVDMGGLSPDSLFIEFLDADEKHLWRFDNDVEGNNLTVNAVSTDVVDIVVIVIDPSGAALIAQDNAGAGQVEVVSDLNMSQAGEYQIVVYAVNDAVGDYGLMALDDLSSPFIFDVIAYNEPVFTSFNESVEQFWFFTGDDTDTVSITADPNDTADIGIDFLGPDNEALIIKDDNPLDLGGEGETEQLLNYRLPISGLYGLWLYGEAEGTITVDLILTN
ncbi:MAG: hypothetical protein GY803_09790 [Chloroflexi bacterium]|nr:hypothetical protein [Chloroflexota bacterium]